MELAALMGMNYDRLYSIRLKDPDLNSLCISKMMGSGMGSVLEQALPDDWRDVLNKVPRGSKVVHSAAALDMSESVFYRMRLKNQDLDAFVRERLPRPNGS